MSEKQRKFGTDLLVSSKNQNINNIVAAPKLSSLTKNTIISSSTKISTSAKEDAENKAVGTVITRPSSSFSSIASTPTSQCNEAGTGVGSSKRNLSGRDSVIYSHTRNPPSALHQKFRQASSADESPMSRGTTKNVINLPKNSSHSTSLHPQPLKKSGKRRKATPSSAIVKSSVCSPPQLSSSQRIHPRAELTMFALERSSSFQTPSNVSPSNCEESKQSTPTATSLPNKDSNHTMSSTKKEGCQSTPNSICQNHHPLLSYTATTPTLADLNATSAAGGTTSTNKSVKRAAAIHNQEVPSSSYTVEFDFYKPLGMQLEPVIKSSAREIGCRVVRFIDNLVQGMESAARGSGLVHVGDVIVAIDGINVLSKSYQGIIEALKSKPKDGVRRIKFRNVQKGELPSLLFSEVSKGSPTKSSKKNFSLPNQSKIKQESDTVLIGKKLFAEDIGTAGAEDSPNDINDSRSNPIACNNDEDQGISTSHQSISGSDSNVRSTPAFTNHHHTMSETWFSPSSVRKFVQNNNFSDTRAPLTSATPHRRGYNLRTLPETIRKAIHQSVIQPASTIATSTVVATARTIGEFLIGHSISEFEEAIRLKYDLLQELSKVRANIEGDKDKIKQLEQENDELRRNNSFLGLSSQKRAAVDRVSTSFQDKEEVIVTEQPEFQPSSSTKKLMSMHMVQRQGEQFLDETLASLSLEDQVGTLRSLSNDQRKRISAQLQELLKQKDQIKDLWSKIQQLTLELTASNEAFHEARSSVAMANEATEQMRAEYESKMKIIDDEMKTLKLRYEDAKLREDKLRSDVKIRDNCINSIEKSSTLLAQKNATLQSELDDMQRNLSDAMDRLIDLESQLKLTKSEVLSIASSFENKSKEAETLHMELKSTIALNKRLSREKSDLMVELSECRESQENQKNRFESEIEGLQALVQNLHKEAVEYRELSERKQEELMLLHDNFAEKENMIEQLKYGMRSVEKQRDDALSAVQDQKGTALRSEEEKELLLNEISTHERRNRMLVEEKSSFSGKHDEVLQELFSTKSELSRIKSVLFDLENCNASLRDESERLQKAAKEAEHAHCSTVQDFQRQVTTLKKESQELAESETDSKRKLVLLDQKLQLLEVSSSKTMLQLQQASFQLLSNKTELETSKNEKKQVEDINAKMKADMNHILQQTALEERNLTEKMLLSENEKSRLEDEIDALKINREEMLAEIIALKGQLKACQETLSAKTSEAVDLQEEMNELKNMIQSSAQALAHCESMLNTAIFEKNTITEEMSSKFVEIQDDMKVIKSEKDYYQASCDNAMAMLNEQVLSKQALEDRIAQIELSYDASDKGLKIELLTKESLIEKMKLEIDEAHKNIESENIEALKKIEKINLEKEQLSKALSEREECYNVLSKWNAKISSQLEEKTSQLLSQKEEINVLQIQLKKSTSFSAVATNEISLLRSLLNKTEKSWKIVTDDFMSKLRMLEDKLANNNVEVEALHQRRNDEIVELRIDLRRASEEIQNLTMENEDLRRKLLGTELSNSTLQQAVKNIESKLSTACTEYAKNVSNVAAENAALLSENKELTDNVIELQSQLRTSQEACCIQLSENKALKEEVSQLTKMFETSSQSLSCCEATLRIAINEKDSVVHETGRMLTELQEKVKVIELEKAYHQSSYADSLIKLDDLLLSKQALEDRIIHMEIGNEMSNNDHKNELLLKDTLIEQMKLELDEARKSSATEQNDALKEIYRTREELFKALSEKEEVYKALLRDKTNLSSQLEEKTSQLLSQNENIDALQMQLDDMKSFKALAKNEISQVRSLLDQAMNSLEVVTFDSMSKIRILEDQLAMNNAEVETLHLRWNGEMDSLRSDLQKALEEVQNLTLENEVMRRNVSRVKIFNPTLKGALPESDELSKDKEAVLNNPHNFACITTVPVPASKLRVKECDLYCVDFSDAVLPTDAFHSSSSQQPLLFTPCEVLPHHITPVFGKESSEIVFGLRKSYIIHDNLSDTNERETLLYTSLQARDQQPSKFAKLHRELLETMQSSNVRVALCEAEMSAAIFQRDATLVDSRLTSAAAFSAIEQIESEFISLKAWLNHFFSKNQLLEAKISEMELAQEVASRTNYDLQMENHFLRKVSDEREAKIQPLYIELKSMNAKLNRCNQQDDNAEILRAADCSTWKSSLENLQEKSLNLAGQWISGVLDDEFGKSIKTEQPESITSLSFYDLFSRHSMILLDLQGINQVIRDAVPFRKFNESSNQFSQDTLNTSLEFERDLLIMEIEQRDELLHTTSINIDDIVKQLLSLIELLRQKEQIVLLLANHLKSPENERVESSDSQVLLPSNVVNCNSGMAPSEMSQMDVLREENYVEERIKSFKAREDVLKSTISNLQEEVKSAEDEALHWKQQFLASDEKWRLKMESSKVFSRCFVKFISRVLLAKQTKVARIGVAFGTWRTIATFSRDVRSTTLKVDHVVASGDVYPIAPESTAIARATNSRRVSQHMSGDDNMEAQIKLAAARIVARNMAKHILTAEARAFRVWSCVTSRSKAFSDHVGVAEQMANQLDATRLKLSLLRRHLEQTGIIQQTAITVKKSNRRPTGLK